MHFCLPPPRVKCVGQMSRVKYDKLLPIVNFYGAVQPAIIYPATR